MTFEQWAEEMKKGLSSQINGNPTALNRNDSNPSWNHDRFGEELEEDSPHNPSHDS